MGVVIQKPVTNLSGYARHGATDLPHETGNFVTVAWTVIPSYGDRRPARGVVPPFVAGCGRN
jgi:hypothetical protein